MVIYGQKCCFNVFLRAINNNNVVFLVCAACFQKSILIVAVRLSRFAAAGNNITAAVPPFAMLSTAPSTDWRRHFAAAAAVAFPPSSRSAVPANSNSVPVVFVWRHKFPVCRCCCRCCFSTSPLLIAVLSFFVAAVEEDFRRHRKHPTSLALWHSVLHTQRYMPMNSCRKLLLKNA